MAWNTTSNQAQTMFSSLFIQTGDDIAVSENCLDILEQILRKLAVDDYVRTFRRTLSFGQNIRKHIIPLLLHVKDDTKLPTASKIIDTVIKILVNLTIPVEYLISIESSWNTDAGKSSILEINKLLSSSKEVFTETKIIKAIVDHIKFMIESESKPNLEHCENINNCLLLLRNILHIPENKHSSSNGFSHTSVQNQIMWNLFTHSIDKIIIYLMSCSQKVYWAVTLVQLIALIYKDQHVGTIQKLLNIWLEASYSDSSEDNESNTSPPDQGSDESSPVVTSDPTSDSSDNGGYDLNKLDNNSNNRVIMERAMHNSVEIIRTAQARNKTTNVLKRNTSTETENTTSSGISSMGHSLESNDVIVQPSSHNTSKRSSISMSNHSEISDCGYVTQVENQESISTSSNEDDQPLQKPVHQKPPNFQKTRYNTIKNRSTTCLDKKELRRKKLVKRRKANVINMKGLLHHQPTDEDISNILKEFTVDFLLKGYGTLVSDLYAQLISNIHIDTSHFFWLVTYFLKFAVQLELDPDHISPVLSYDILSYLVFQGIWVCEELEISSTIPNMDLKPCLRRMHLVVTAIREFLQGVEAYQKMLHLSKADEKHLTSLQSLIVKSKDLKMLFVLLLRQYNVNIQSKQYLQDLILTNHHFTVFVDNSCSTPEQHCDIREHLKNFAVVEIMRQYGILLENFKENGELVNNCIFTMMHHAAGDLDNVETLFQPNILKTFSQIWETDYEICDDWSDLIEYVIHKFINNPGNGDVKSNDICADSGDDNFESEETSSECSSLDEILILFRWTREEKDKLLKYYNQNKETSDTIAKITENYKKNGYKLKSRISIVNELLQQNIITEDEYTDLINDNYTNKIDSLFSGNVKRKRIVAEIPLGENGLINGDIKRIKEYLCKENKGEFIEWLQNVLLEACHVKLLLKTHNNLRENVHLCEPSVYYYVLSNLPIPLVPWTVEQANILKHQPFVLLLHKLGFHLSTDTGKIFVRIPNFWTPDYIFSMVQLLGPVDRGKLKFKTETLKTSEKCDTYSTATAFPDAGSIALADVKLVLPTEKYTPLSTQLSIAIPDNEIKCCDVLPPELTVAQKSNDLPKIEPHGLDYSTIQVQENDLVLNDDIERNSNCDTASVASDLTRMYVSDEDEKIILVLRSSEKTT